MFILIFHRNYVTVEGLFLPTLGILSAPAHILILFITNTTNIMAARLKRINTNQSGGPALSDKWKREIYRRRQISLGNTG